MFENAFNKLATADDVGKICIFSEQYPTKNKKAKIRLGILCAYIRGLDGVDYRCIVNGFEMSFEYCSVLTVEQFKEIQANPSSIFVD